MGAALKRAREQAEARAQAEAAEAAIRTAAIVKIQTAFRGHLARRNARMQEAITRIQCASRGYLARSHAKTIHKAVAQVQHAARGYLARRHVQKKWEALALIQRCSRGHLARQRARRTREAIAKIQSVFRGHHARCYAKRLRIRTECALQMRQRREEGIIRPTVFSKTNHIISGEETTKSCFAPVRLEEGATVVHYESPSRGVRMWVHIEDGCTHAGELHMSLVEGDRLCRDFGLPRFDLEFNDKSQPKKPVVIRVEASAAFHGKQVFLCTGDGEIIEEAYFAVDNPMMLRACTPHFSSFRFSLGDLDCKVGALDIQEQENYTRGYDDWEEASTQYSRGDMPYYLPFGFRRLAIDIGVKEGLGDFEDAVVGFHGTTLQSAQNILKGGFRIPSARGVVPRPGHIPLDLTVNGIARWADAIFFSPSYKYCMAPGYAGDSTTLADHDGKLFVATGSYIQDKVLYCILQCRIRKDALTVNPDTQKPVFAGTTGEWNSSDSRVPSSEMEYRVTDTSKILIYGVLFRSEPLSSLYEFSNPARR